MWPRVPSRLHRRKGCHAREAVAAAREHLHIRATASAKARAAGGATNRLAPLMKVSGCALARASPDQLGSTTQAPPTPRMRLHRALAAWRVAAPTRTR